jgi:hypothetical protein
MIKFFRHIRRDLMEQNKTGKYFKYAIGEIVLVVMGILIALSLSNWNDNEKDTRAESKILVEILNGLEKDKVDVDANVGGHKFGIKSCQFWRDVFNNKNPNLDTLQSYYFILTRDFISIQNSSGYETLKSKGFELIKNDSLRTKIISLYEYDYQSIRKLEEEYNELQFQKNYFHEINRLVAPYLKFDLKGDINGIELPLKLTEPERKILLSYLWKIQINREFILKSYTNTKENITDLTKRIEEELKQ